MKTAFYSFIILISILQIPLVMASKADSKYKDSYKTISNPNAFISSEFATAKADNKKLIFILGANWCHDSRSLAKKLDDKGLTVFMDRSYRVSLIDVGYLDQGFEFLTNANMETFYATPTVLIFDPATGKHINKKDMHIWGGAAKISPSDTYKYFENYSRQHNDDNTIFLSETQKQSIEKLEQFRLNQEQRIRASYDILGPMLKRYEEKKEDKNFDDYWEALAKLRNKLPKDLKKLREQILNNTNINIESLKFPQYAALPWE